MVWEATSIVEIGQVDEGGVRPVDPLVQAALRVQTESFRDDVLRSLKLPLDDDASAQTSLIRHSLLASGIPGTNLFSMSVRGLSQEEAKTTLEVAQNQLIATHAEVVDAVRGRLQNQLKTVDTNISKLQAAQDAQLQTLKRVSASKDTGNGAVQALLSDMVDATTVAQLQMAQQRRAQLVGQLGADRTYNTRVIGDTTVSRRPITPKRPVFAGVGALLGLFAGLLIAGRRYVGAKRTA
ncbi:hypothetical protein DWV00_25675 [Trinickia dinghuensis]|uniref:Chain-length determining protein n=1 Tax=Trinickia dinghuensis TaxID=2291023 RepID=A0A3D8JUH8_9BURK|nr:hypothetical protein DWV00_25675 [Trinickia dinghuensis]